MKLTSKVGSLLGMKQRADEPNFGDPLNLEQIAVDFENSVTSPERNTLDIEISEHTAQDTVNVPLETAAPQTNTRRPSVLDLEFMRSPLDEIGLEYGNENAPKAQDETQINPHTPPMPIETFDDVKNIAEEGIEADLTTQVSEPASPTPAPLSSSLPTEYLQPPMSAALTQKLSTHTEPNPALTSDSDKALALSLRSDNETGFAVFGPNEQILEMSESFQQILGLSAPTVANMTSYSDVVNYVGQHAELGDKDVEASKQKEILSMRERIAAGIPQTFDWTTTVRSGAILKFSNTFTVNNHLVTAVKNVSDEIEKERILRASLMLGTVGYWTYSFKTGASSLSEYITNKLTDEENSNVKTQGLISIIHPDDAVRVKSEFEAAVQTRTKMDCEFRIVTERQSEVFIRMIGEVELSPSSNKPDVFIAFLNDLTEDRKREKELYAVKEQSKNKSQFLARMSHEIKTPLNAIVGMTEALRDEVDNDEARETASFIADAADNLNNILSQTLEHERLSTSEISLEEDNVNIAEVIKSTVAMWKKPCDNKNLKLITHISNEMPKTLTLDRSRLRQCLTNLLSNAVKFTESGSITLAAAPMNIDGENPKLLVAVRDTGIGMSAAAIENVFKPFQQGDTTIQRRFGGSGLGMSITQHIVKAMDGHIKIKSVEGEGSTIAITLPLRLAQSLNAPKQASEIRPDVEPHHLSEPAPVEPEKPKQETVQNLPAETFHQNTTAPAIKDAKTETTPDAVRKNVPIVPSDYSGFRVLVVEDNPINQAVVRKLLSNHIASMDFAFHGEEAMQILETTTFDVILMDIHMPVKDGIETTLEIRNSGKAWADTVIVALTADPDYQQKRVCRNIGMNDALAKPVKRQELLDVMQRVLNERLERENKTSLAISA